MRHSTWTTTHATSGSQRQCQMSMNGRSRPLRARAWKKNTELQYHRPINIAHLWTSQGKECQCLLQGKPAPAPFGQQRPHGSEITPIVLVLAISDSRRFKAAFMRSLGQSGYSSRPSFSTHSGFGQGVRGCQRGQFSQIETGCNNCAPNPSMCAVFCGGG